MHSCSSSYNNRLGLAGILQAMTSWLQDASHVAPPYRLGGSPQDAARLIHGVVHDCQALFGQQLQCTLPDSVALNDALCAGLAKTRALIYKYQPSIFLNTHKKKL